MNPAEFAIKNRLISFLVLAASLVAGGYAYNNLARFEDPEFTIRQAQVVCAYPGATPQEVADEVADALETAAQRMQEVDEIKSVSSAGLCRLTVEMKHAFSKTPADLATCWTKLRNQMADAAGALPPGAQPPQVYDDFGDVYGLYYLVTGEGFSPKELHAYTKGLRDELMAVDNVAKVAILGQQNEAIYVEIDRTRADALGVSVQRVYQDLAQQNSVVPAGDLKLGGRRLLITPSGQVDSVSALGDVVVSTSGGGDAVRRVTTLRDIATIRRGYQDPPEKLFRFNGRPAIALGVSNVTGGNVARLGAAIDARIAQTLGSRPLGVEVHSYYHQGKIVNAAVLDFAVNVLAALVIVLVTLLIFMGLRSAVIIGLVLMFTIGATLATMYVVNIPMHRISLGALIIALGMLVDNAIVVTDGILVGTKQGRKKLGVAKDIVGRTVWPLLGGTLVGIIAFAPIGLAPGSTAEFTGHLFWVVLISLLFSWVFAITAVPYLADLFFRESADGAAGPPPEGRFTVAYKAFMRRVLAWRWPVIGIAAGLFVLSVWGFRFVTPGFFPASTTPQIVVDYWLPEGTDISQTTADMIRIETELAGRDGVAEVLTLIGAGGPRFMLVYSPESSNPAYGQLLVKVESYDRIAGLLPEIQAYLDANYPDAQAKVWQFQLGPGGGSKIEAAFSGPDPAVLRRLANEAKGVMAADGRTLSIKDDWRQPVSVIEPKYSETRGRRLGISREDVAAALQGNFSGERVGVYREGDTLIPIIARAPVGERVGVSDIATLPVISPVTGASVPLIETLDDIAVVWRDGRLIRNDRILTIKAQCDPQPGEFASDLLARLRPGVEAIPLPEGYRLEWKGEAGDSEEANGDLAGTLPLAFLAMVGVMVLLFNRIRQPLLIWLVVPLALIGVVLGLVVTGTPLEFMAILGLLSLSGLLIKNAIVLVDQMDLEIRAGKPRFDAVVDSAASRVRPVMMGSLTTVLGVIPLFADAFFSSMAVVLVFGLTFATVLTLLVIPALYAAFFNVRASETSGAGVREGT